MNSPAFLASVTLVLQLTVAQVVPSVGGRPRSDLDSTRYQNPIADQLEEAGDRLARDPATYREAASAFEQAAGARGWADPRSATLLTNAARIYHAAGDAHSAIRVLLELADQSLANGRVIEAADALIDCSWVARDAGRADAALEAAARALLLTDSPLLSEAERARLRGRLGL